MSWTPELKQRFDNIRRGLVNNYNNNANVIAARSVPAALDFPNAREEVNQSKTVVENTTGRLAEQAEILTQYLKIMNAKQGTELAAEVSETEMKLRKLEAENRKYEAAANISKSRTEAVYNKYEGNAHSQSFFYAPWEITSSSWFSYSPTNPYMNLNPSSRSGLIFIAFFFGFSSIIVLVARAALSYYSGNFSSSKPVYSAPAVIKQGKPGIVRRF